MIYRGIDFANRDSNLGQCYIEIDQASKTIKPLLELKSPTTEFEGTAVDCAFGTTSGFESLLKGTVPPDCEWDRGFKTRATENWLRHKLWDYQTNNYWRGLSDTSPQHYVNKTAHIQSTVGLVIVPQFLHWLLSQPNQNIANLENARLGIGPIVEAHPRLSLIHI